MALKVFRWLHRRGISRQKLKKNWMTSWLGDHLLNKDLWLFHRDGVAKAWLMGAIVALSPFMGIQIPTAAVLAVLIRANFPISFTWQWVSNPVTAVVYYPLTYLFGIWLMGQYDGTQSITWDHMNHIIWHPSLWGGALYDILIPTLLGCTVVGVVVGVSGYVVIMKFWPERQVIEVEGAASKVIHDYTDIDEFEKPEEEVSAGKR